MKRLILALLAAGTVLVFAGCCCDKAEKNCRKPVHKICHKKHHHTPKTCAPAKCPAKTSAPQQQTASETIVVEAVD